MTSPWSIKTSLKHYETNMMQLWSFSKWFHRFLEPWTLLKCVIPQFDVTFAASPNQNVHKQLDRFCISCWLLTWYFQTSSFKKLKINIINIAQATQSASQRQQQKTHSVNTDFNTVTMEEMNPQNKRLVRSNRNNKINRIKRTQIALRQTNGDE